MTKEFKIVTNKDTMNYIQVFFGENDILKVRTKDIRKESIGYCYVIRVNEVGLYRTIISLRHLRKMQRKGLLTIDIYERIA